ncbi:MAG TPA: tetratricopeptide repeat protein [Bacteroidia bacterium]|nr:tetratricopeptide repeat protein [Bacteroidia bacterium]
MKSGKLNTKFIVKWVLCFSLFTIHYSLVTAQSRKIDSLQNVLKTGPEDTNKVNLLNLLCEQLKEISKYDSSMACATRAKLLAEKLGFEKGRALALRNIAVAFWSQGNYAKALEYSTLALNESRKIGNKTIMAASLGSIGTIYESEGDYPKALEYDLQSLTISREIGNKQSTATTLSNIAIVYFDLGNRKEALDYALKALDIYEEKEIRDSSNIARSYGNIGSLYVDAGNYAKAIEYDSMALVLYRQLKDKDGIGINMENIGIVYENEKDYPKALAYNFDALAIYREIGDQSGIAYTLIDIGSIYTRDRQYSNAHAFLDSGLITATKIGEKASVQYAYQYRSTLDSSMGNYKAGLEDYKNYILYRDSLVNEANTKKTVQAEMNYEFEQQQLKEKAEQDKKDAVAASDRRRQNIVIVSISVGLVLVLMFSVLLLNRFRITQQQKKIIEEQKHIVEEKNKDITDSIHYASRIQRALLTTDGYISKYLPEHFILFKPKDIVSGDFYWAYSTPHSAFLLCAGDCTGHGVPGAFMSLLNISMLNETTIEKKIHSPAAILDDVREHIIKALNPEGKDTGSKDGMDCVLCSFDFANKKLDFACANNPLWIIRGAELIEFKPDKMPVGIQGEKNLPFTLQSTTLQKGDLVYIFTDGYADQFGGPKGKKFKYKALQEKILAISHRPLAEQRNILNDTFEQWKGNLEQVDDVLMIGVRI